MHCRTLDSAPSELRSHGKGFFCFFVCFVFFCMSLIKAVNNERHGKILSREVK